MEPALQLRTTENEVPSYDQAVVMASAPAPLRPTDYNAAWARRLITSLPHRSWIRRLGVGVLRQEPMNQDTTFSLLAMLEAPFGFRWKEVLLAIWILPHLRLTSAQKHDVARVLEHIVGLSDWPDPNVRGANLVVRTLWLSLVLHAGAGIASGVLGNLGDLLSNLAQFCITGIATTFGLSLAMLPISAGVEDHRLNQIRAAAAWALGELRQTESIGPLATSLQSSLTMQQSLGSRQVRLATADALKKTLPTLTNIRIGQLSPEVVPALCAALMHPDEALILATLQALERVGDGRAVLIVSRLAARGKTPAIRQAAQNLLPLLEERSRQETAPYVLLRPSSTPDVPPNELLRPASANRETDPQRLLRAVSEEYGAR